MTQPDAIISIEQTTVVELLPGLHTAITTDQLLQPIFLFVIEIGMSRQAVSRGLLQGDLFGKSPYAEVRLDLRVSLMIHPINLL